ncbi:NUDIX hydrolase [Halalkalicoccus jeotgali]|uniref:NUDIX hydrolase n=1 Tax=Halalkalicoccus jeotgali (strain DSM 18796 / CECT 7217 / JCM 14584 / KCTC 4019 / B3) TaxID=795797 RepID=D8J2S8_HALJB|nr:NUDIX hydrolase [Halalkalicoccus jeotgali]ADJ15035.1 NUDIX hydrolase [Halalkalicoccus jeotgali B3]ELY34947.1 NUDIX hydrolase [Halalkalicoccus jeotgali B3]
METTRHFVATVYVVYGGATLLHEHRTLGLWLPPGGHLDRDELPHEAALREVREETGLDVELLTEHDGVRSPTVESLPEPAHLLLEDIDTYDGAVGHQHIDFVYYGRADSRTLDPGDGEQSADAWEWVTSEELDEERFDADVTRLGREAIGSVE